MGSTPIGTAKFIYNHLKRLHTIVESTPLYETLRLARKPPYKRKGIVKTGMYTINPNKRLPVGEIERRDGYYMGDGNAWGVCLSCKEDIRWVQIPYSPPYAGLPEWSKGTHL